MLHCFQEIPCNACTAVCPNALIATEGNSIMGLPKFVECADPCVSCYRCVAICPGLAVTIVDFRDDSERPVVTFPFEIGAGAIKVGDGVEVLADDATSLGRFPVIGISFKHGTYLVHARLPKAIAKSAAAVWTQHADRSSTHPTGAPPPRDDALLCRCERVTAGQVRALVREGVRDMNAIKTMTRAGMGACGGKCCEQLVTGIFRQEKVDIENVVPRVARPLFVEVPLGVLAGVKAP